MWSNSDLRHLWIIIWPDPLTWTQGVPEGSISLYINDLPLCLSSYDVEIYADDTTLWTSDHSMDNIQHNLQNSLNNASRWFTSNQMVPNAKKTKLLLIATRQKLQHVNQPILDLYLNGNRTCRRSRGWKTPGRQDRQSPYLLNSRIYLLKRAKGYLSLHYRKLLLNALVKPIFEYWCSVWGNAPKDQIRNAS